VNEFRRKTVSGVTWTAAGQAGRQVVILAANVALARLLTPRDFGLIATAVIFSNFTFVISEQGLLTALVQRKEVEEAHLSSTFWLNLALGGALAAIFAACAPLTARIYHEPNLTQVMRIISLMFVIYPLGMVHKAVLTRALSFRSIAISEITSAALGGGAGVLLAWKGFGVNSVAYQFIVEFVSGTIVFWLLCSWRPRASFRWPAVRDLMGFSSHLLISDVATYWVRNVDNLLIGLYLGTFALGLYSRAYSVMLFPMSRLSWVFSRVMTRSFAIIQDDPARVKAIFLKMTRVIALATFPMMLGVAATSEAFVACVFGGQWGEMVPTLRILAVVGMIQSVTSLVSNLYLSRGRSDLNLRVKLPIQALQVLGIVAGLRGGILGVAVGYAAMSLLTVPIDLHYGGGLVGLGVGEFFRNLTETLLCASAMAVAVAAAKFFLAPFPATAVLACQVALGVAVYAGLVHLFNIEAYRDFREFARERLAAAGGAA
jgi:PST family polysaccharide transporter